MLWFAAIGCSSECPEGEVEDARGDCHEPTDVTPGVPNNQAVLDGASFPEGVGFDASLVRSVPFAAADLDPALQADTMFLGRYDADSTYVYGVVPVTNISGRSMCYVRFDSFAYVGAAGELAEDIGAFVQGSVAQVDVTWTDTCLLPGRTGYAFTLAPVAFDEVTSVDATSSAVLFEARGTVASVIPRSYTVDGSTLTVTADNDSTGAIVVGDHPRWLQLDDDGQPLLWGFFEDADAIGEVGPDESFTLVADEPTLATSASKLWVAIDFEPAGAS